MIYFIGDPTIVFLLLSSNADPNSLNETGDTPLLAIIKSEYPPVEDIIKLLIRFGADVNAKEPITNNTVFHLVNDKNIPVNIIMHLSSVSPKSPYTIKNSSQLTAAQVSFIFFNFSNYFFIVIPSSIKFKNECCLESFMDVL